MSLTFIVSYFQPKYTDDTRKIDSDKDSQMSTKKSVVPPIDSLLGGATLTLFYLYSRFLDVIVMNVLSSIIQMQLYLLYYFLKKPFSLF